MIKTILVPATGKAADDAGFAGALSVARTFGAHIDALHVRLDAVEVAVAMSTEGAGGPLLGGIIDDLTRDADAAEAAARTRFMDFCTRSALPLMATPTGPDGQASAHWHVETGQDTRWLVAYGRTADLLVAARGGPDESAMPRSIIEALLLETGRPLLIPSGPEPISLAADRIVIAWKPTPQAARAVAFAMPFLARAKQVDIVTVEEADEPHEDTERLTRYLAWHGITAKGQRLAPGLQGAAETLIDATKGAAGLLVMGGYGHTRLREWVFGGFTERVLSDAPLPVLIAH